MEPLIPLVPDFDYCVALRAAGFPQITRFKWLDTGVRDANDKIMARLLFYKDEQLNNVQLFRVMAAPTVEDFMRVIGPQFYVIFVKGVWVMIDQMKSGLAQAESHNSNGQQVQIVGMKLHRVTEAANAASCWAKGILKMVHENEIQFKVAP